MHLSRQIMSSMFTFSSKSPHCHYCPWCLYKKYWARIKQQYFYNLHTNNALGFSVLTYLGLRKAARKEINKCLFGCVPRAVISSLSEKERKAQNECSRQKFAYLKADVTRTLACAGIAPDPEREQTQS